MPFATFMSLALYHDRFGYYAGAERTGRRGHFMTSTELDPAFGQLWAQGFEHTWERCGRPSPFEVVEIGPGEGGFAEAVLAAAPGPFGSALSYRLVERMERGEKRQRRRLSGRGRVLWSRSLEEAPPAAAGCVFAAEVLDNVPVHVVEKRRGRVLEACVDVSEEQFSWRLVPPSTPELVRYLERCGMELAEGHRAEVSLAAKALVRRGAELVGRGGIVFVDYGLRASELARRPRGTLVSYSAGGADDDVLAEPGDRDITAHVNWTAVVAGLKEAGCEVFGPLSQRDVLRRLGAAELDRALSDEHRAAVTQGRGGVAVTALSRRHALGALLDPGGLGGFEVVVGLKGIAPPPFLTPLP